MQHFPVAWLTATCFCETYVAGNKEPGCWQSQLNSGLIQPRLPATEETQETCCINPWEVSDEGAACMQPEHQSVAMPCGSYSMLDTPVPLLFIHCCQHVCMITCNLI
eukprot:jgi/Chrzof1/8200/Cz03g01090.t1